MPAKSWKDLMNEAEQGSKEFEPLTPGFYTFVIKEPAKVGQTSKENPKFTINPSVESGPRENARVFHTFSVSDSPYAMKNFFFGDLAAIGLGSSFFDTNPTEQQIAQALLGKRFTAEVFLEDAADGSGKQYPRLRNFSAPTSAAPSAGVPTGLPTGTPMAASAPAPAPQAAAPTVESPWATPAAPAAPAPQVSNAVPLPPAFG